MAAWLLLLASFCLSLAGEEYFVEEEAWETFLLEGEEEESEAPPEGGRFLLYFPLLLVGGVVVMAVGYPLWEASLRSEKETPCWEGVKPAVPDWQEVPAAWRGVVAALHQGSEPQVTAALQHLPSWREQPALWEELRGAVSLPPLLYLCLHAKGHALLSLVTYAEGWLQGEDLLVAGCVEGKGQGSLLSLLCRRYAVLIFPLSSEGECAAGWGVRDFLYRVAQRFPLLLDKPCTPSPAAGEMSFFAFLFQQGALTPSEKWGLLKSLWASSFYYDAQKEALAEEAEVWEDFYEECQGEEGVVLLEMLNTLRAKLGKPLLVPSGAVQPRGLYKCVSFP